MPTAVQLLATVLSAIESEQHDDASFGRLHSALNSSVPQLPAAFEAASAAEREAIAR